MFVSHSDQQIVLPPMNPVGKGFQTNLRGKSPFLIFFPPYIVYEILSNKKHKKNWYQKLQLFITNPIDSKSNCFKS